MKLKHFKVDPTRTNKIVDVEFYQMNLIRALEQARKADPELFKDNPNPCWSDVAKDPLRAKGFITRMLQAVFLGQNNLPELNVDFQVGEIEDSFRVAMMFLPGSLTIKGNHLKNFVKIAEQTLKGWRVLEISGAGEYHGKKISNKNAEKITKAVVEECRESKTPLLIISRGMAQRSYSIGEITSLYLCYDEGDAGATTQKISRALTPNQEGKIGRIFSLSFDPNRDDKFDTMLIAAAQNYAQRKDVEVTEALRRVVNTIDIFSCEANGRVDIDHDTYLQQILERNSLSRMVGKQADLAELDYDEIVKLAMGNSNYNQMEGTDAADKNKQPGDKNKKGLNKSELDKEALKLYDKARKVLTTIVEHLPYLAFMTNTTTVRDSLVRCAEVEDYSQYVTEEFGVPPEVILDFFDRGVLNYDLASLQKDAKVIQIQGN